jgi:hypothetical protein
MDWSRLPRKFLTSWVDAPRCRGRAHSYGVAGYGLPYPGYAIQIASYGMRYVGIFAERICVKHP